MNFSLRDIAGFGGGLSYNVPRLRIVDCILWIDFRRHSFEDWFSSIPRSTPNLSVTGVFLVDCVTGLNCRMHDWPTF